MAGVAFPVATAAHPVRRLRRNTPVGSFATLPCAQPPGALARNDDDPWAPQLLASEGLEPEAAGTHKSVYLVTCPHPTMAGAKEHGLGDTNALSREDIARAVLDALARPLYADPGNRARERSTVQVQRLVVFREKHAPAGGGETHAHFHVAILAARSFRFLPYKRALRERHNLASHWSCSHDGYWPAVRYGAMPTPKKAADELDAEPLAWARNGPHPDLFTAAQEPTTAAALRRRREKSLKAAASVGKAEPRATELDLYPAIVHTAIRNNADDPWGAQQLIQHLREHGSPELYKVAWRLRKRLSSIIDDVWSWETVGETLKVIGPTRWERLLVAAQEPCICQCAWRRCAEWVLAANALDVRGFATNVLRALHDGRRPNLPVVVLMGLHGGEGKSFLLAPLRSIYGEDYVQATPATNSYPLLGLDMKCVVPLEEWSFDNTVLPMATQLLWFEGKAVPLMRPQNKDYEGHLLYKGTAPIFVTCAQTDLGPIEARARAAAAAGHASQETMLMRRLTVYSLRTKLPMPAGCHVPECGRCFAQLLLEHGTGPDEA